MYRPPEGFLHVPFYDQKYDVFQMGLVIWGLFCDKSHPYELSQKHNEEIERYKRTRKVDKILPCLINIYLKNHGTPGISDIKNTCKHNIWLQTEFFKQVKDEFGEIIPETDFLEIVRKTIKKRALQEDGFEKVVRNGEYFVEPVNKRYENLKCLLRTEGENNGHRIIDLIKEMLEFMPENRIDSKTAFKKVHGIAKKIFKTDKFSVDPVEFCEKTCFEYSKEAPSDFEDFLGKCEAMHGRGKHFKVLSMPDAAVGDDLSVVYKMVLHKVQGMVEIDRKWSNMVENGRNGRKWPKKSENDPE